MNLSAYLSHREKYLDKTHKQFIDQLSTLQMRSNTNLARHLHNKRFMLGLNYSVLASRSGISPEVFSKLENGKITPNSKFLYKISSVYQIPRERLVLDIKEDLVYDLSSICQVSKSELLWYCGNEISRRINKAYGEIKTNKKYKISKRSLEGFLEFVLIALVLPWLLNFIFHFNIGGILTIYTLIIFILLAFSFILRIKRVRSLKKKKRKFKLNF